MDLLAFIQTANPTKVRVAERQRAKDEPRLLESTIGRVVPLLSIAPASNELKASVDKLFDEGASGDRGDADVRSVSVTTDTILEEVAPLQPKRQRKRKTVVADAGGPSNPPKKFVISSDSSHYSGANIAEAKVDSIDRSSAPTIATITTVTAAIDAYAMATRAPVAPSLFGVGSYSTGTTDSIPGGFFDVSGSDFFIGGIRAVVDPDSDLQKVYVLRWSATNGFGLDDIRICREMLDEFAPSKFFTSVCGMDHDQLFTEFNVGAARQISLNAEVRMRDEV
nr:hypothetical protein [Tanacetum cinerariifolium]